MATPPLVGLGISFSPGLELFASLALSLGLVCLAVVMLRNLGKIEDGWARVLLGCSGTALLVSMPLAASYAVGEMFPTVRLTIPGMIVSHGRLNAIGFSLGGLLGFQRDFRGSG